MNQLTTQRSLAPTLIAEVVPESYCRQCGTSMAGRDRFCGRCGSQCKALTDVANPHFASPSPGTSELIESALKSKLAVASMIAALGPIGIAAMWFSPSFSRPSKIAWTLCYFVVVFVMPLLIAWYWLSVSVRPIVETLGH